MSEPSIYQVFEEAERRLRERAIGYTVRNAEYRDLDSIIGINQVSLPEHYPRSFYEDLLEDYGKAFYVAVYCNIECFSIILE